MNDDELLRYSRQIVLPEIDAVGQMALQRSTAVVIGVGGLGSPVALYLAAAGVGRLRLVDPDYVELSNLQRQIAHGTADIDHPKVDSAAHAIHRLNPGVDVEVRCEAAAPDNLPALLEGADAVVDGCDRFSVRYAVNEACLAAGKPLISGAVLGWDLQVAVFRNDQGGKPCYECLFPRSAEASTDDALRCSEQGVPAPLPGVAGSMQAVQTLQLLSGVGASLERRLWTFDALAGRSRVLKIPADPGCPACGTPSTG